MVNKFASAHSLFPFLIKKHHLEGAYLMATHPVGDSSGWAGTICVRLQNIALSASCLPQGCEGVGTCRFVGRGCRRRGRRSRYYLHGCLGVDISSDAAALLFLVVKFLLNLTGAAAGTEKMTVHWCGKIDL